METKVVLFKALLFIVFLPLDSFSRTNSNVNLSEELKADQQYFTTQGQTQFPEKISSFACLENNIFQFQVKNIFARTIGGNNDEINFGSEITAFGHAPERRRVSPFCRSPQFP